MNKPTITKIWLGGLIGLALGLLIGGLGLGLMLAYGGGHTPAPTGSGYDFVPTVNAFFWMTIGMMVAGFTVAAAGGVAQLAAWIGALVNTYQLEDKAWFIVLLAGGLLGLSFGLIQFAVMIAYIVAGPDGMALEQPSVPMSAPQPAALAPTT
jgi:hypothetical protein